MSQEPLHMFKELIVDPQELVDGACGDVHAVIVSILARVQKVA